PARAAGLRLRPRARGGPPHPASNLPGLRGDRAKPTLGLGPPARRPEAPRGARGLMGAPALAPAPAPAPARRAPKRSAPKRQPRKRPNRALASRRSSPAARPG